MYVELHSRSAFSFLEGASLPEQLIAACANFNMPAMALLDRDGVYGSPRFHMAAKKAKIKAHIGAEITCEPSGDLTIGPSGHRMIWSSGEQKGDPMIRWSDHPMVHR